MSKPCEVLHGDACASADRDAASAQRRRYRAGDRDRPGAQRSHAAGAFFEKRFAAAKAQPDDFIHIGVMRGGCAARLRHRPHPARRVRPRGRRRGARCDRRGGGEPGARHRPERSWKSCVEIMRRRGVRSLQSQATWTNHDLLRFFDASDFELAPRLALERSVTEPLETSERRDRDRHVDGRSADQREHVTIPERVGDAARDQLRQAARRPISVRWRATGSRCAR